MITHESQPLFLSHDQPCYQPKPQPLPWPSPPLRRLDLLACYSEPRPPQCCQAQSVAPPPGAVEDLPGFFLAPAEQENKIGTLFIKLFFLYAIFLQASPIWLGLV